MTFPAPGRSPRRAHRAKRLQRTPQVGGGSVRIHAPRPEEGRVFVLFHRPRMSDGSRRMGDTTYMVVLSWWRSEGPMPRGGCSTRVHLLVLGVQFRSRLRHRNGPECIHLRAATEDRSLQEKVFEVLGFSKEEAQRSWVFDFSSCVRSRLDAMVTPNPHVFPW